MALEDTAVKVAKVDPEVGVAARAAGAAKKAEQAKAEHGGQGKSESKSESGPGAGSGSGGAGGGRSRDVSRGTSGGRSGAGPAGSLAKWSGKGTGARKMLVTEFVVCSVILALSPLSGKHGTDDVHAWIRRWFAITGLFFMLGLAATGGDKIGRIAAASGAIVTAALLFNDADVFTNLMSHLASQPTPKRTSTQQGGATGKGQIP